MDQVRLIKRLHYRDTDKPVILAFSSEYAGKIQTRRLYADPADGASLIETLKRDDCRVGVKTIAETEPARDCFHCRQTVPADLNLTVSINGKPQSMCCHGCQAVAEAIIAAGHEHFYRVRTEASITGQEVLPDFLRETRIYDDQILQQRFVRRLTANVCETSLILEGINCAACAWLNEQHIASLPGVEQVQVNYATHRAWLRWNADQIALSDILQAIRSIGYRALPYDAQQQQAAHRRQGRAQLLRLSIAGLFGMQVMMLSISLYTGAWSGMAQNFETLFRYLGLGLTLPVMLFSAHVFFVSAWRDLSHARVGMDVPVSLGIGIAFCASVVATISGEGHVYYDSVVMFVFLLLGSRFLEWRARQQSAEAVERLAMALPLMANRLSPQGDSEELVPASALRPGDIVLVRPGETIPADGDLLSGDTRVDESLLTGESLALSKQAGEALIGGSINMESPLRMSVRLVGPDTLLSGIQSMIGRAQSDKPMVARLADRIASKFVLGVLLVSALVAWYWGLKSPDHWLEITLATLIVSCPCALSLATPAALTAALGNLRARGILITRGRALDRLDKVTHVVFDKTGTLTCGKPVLSQVLCTTGVEREFCLKIAASLEYYSEHPLAHALAQSIPNRARLPAENLANQPGGGLSATIEGQEYAIGSIDFVAQYTGLSLPQEWMDVARSETATLVVLTTTQQILCLFLLRDELREDAAELVQKLRQSGKQVMLMSGDREMPVSQVARQVGISDYFPGLSPQQKMARVQALQNAKAVVLMVGDGINDAPVLSSADVSIAMGSATALAKTSADIVLLSNRLERIFEVFGLARRTQSNMRQNFSWALAYNGLAIPAAASGIIAPWMAAIGMSLSSLIVVVNALRLAK